MWLSGGYDSFIERWTTAGLGSGSKRDHGLSAEPRRTSRWATYDSPRLHVAGPAARQLTLSRYQALLKPRYGSLALSVTWHAVLVSEVCSVVSFVCNLCGNSLSVPGHSKHYKVSDQPSRTEHLYFVFA